jgi:DNA-binding NarL/FixJ family response regulator
MPAPIKLLIVDDHPTLRHGFISALKAFDDQFQVVAEAANGEEALLKYVTSKPDVVVTDLHFPNFPTNGIDLIRTLRERYPQVPVIAISAEMTEENLLLTYDVGANGFLSKECSVKEIAKAIDVVFNGFTHFPVLLREALERRKKEPQLTEREKQLMPLIGMCMTAKQMARELARLDPENPISDRTIEIHLRNIRQKLGLTSTKAMIPLSIEYAKKIRK